MTEKPSRGLADVVAASTALSDIDGQARRLYPLVGCYAATVYLVLPEAG